MIHFDLKKVFFAFLFLSLLTWYYFIGYGYSPTSDQASGILIARDIASGNILLHNWSLSTVSFYFTDLIWYAILSLIGVSNKVQSALMPAILLSSLACASVYLIVSKKNAPWAILFTFVPVGIFSSQIFNLAVSHIGAYLYTAIVYVILEKDELKPRIYLKIITAFLCVAIFFSDDISKYSFLIPIALSTSISYFNRREINHAKQLLIILLSYALAKILFLSVVYFGGLSLPGVGSPKLATIPQFLNNLTYITIGSLDIFEANFFGKEIGILSISNIARFLFLIFFYIYLLVSLRKIKDYSTVDSALLLSSVIMPLAFIFSNIPSAVESIRYIAPSLIFGSIFICRNLWLSKRHSSYLVVIGLFTGFAISANAMKTDRHNHEIDELTKFVKDNGLKKGFASFWFASSVSLNSDSVISPVVFNESEGSVKPFLWLSKIENYEGKNDFIIADNQSDRESALKTFGNPTREYRIGSKIIMTWKNGVNLSFSGFHVKTNKYYFGSTGAGYDDKVCPGGDEPFMVTGPYKPLKKGEYNVKILMDGDGPISGDVVSNAGNKTLATFENVKLFSFNVDKTYPDVEVRIYNKKENGCVKEISVSH